MRPVFQVRENGHTNKDMKLWLYSDRLRQPDNLPKKETHGFASLPHSRFAIIGTIVKLQKIIAGQVLPLWRWQPAFELNNICACLSRYFSAG